MARVAVLAAAIIVSLFVAGIAECNPDRKLGFAGFFGARRGFGSPKFWALNPGRVPKALSLVVFLAHIFGPRVHHVYFGHPTLLLALKDESPDPMASLAREASASFINSVAYSDFPLSSEEVVARFNAALDSPQLAQAQSLQFQQLNDSL